MTRFWLALVGYLVVDGTATWASVHWLKGRGRHFLLAAVLGYFCCTFFWLFGLAGAHGPGVARANVIYPIVAMLTGVGASLYAGERMGARSWAGLALGALAILLVVSEQRNGEE
jgi:drug/metabolite transporter (DMT)-like permease